MKLIIEGKQELVRANTKTENYKITNYKCECGASLVKKKVFNKPEKYWYGCLRYPECANRYFLEKNELKKF